MTAAPLWLIQNVRLADRDGLWQIAIDKGRFGAITPMGEAHDESYEVLNARGGLAIPPFIEPHIHLDTTQTAGEPNWNQSGTLFEGIERWAERKALLSHEDVKARAWKTLKWQIANGVQFVRTHVDVSDPTLTALKAMLEVKQEVAPWVELQIVAFPQEGILSYPNGEALLEEALKLGADVVGAIPHFEYTRGRDAVRRQRRLFRRDRQPGGRLRVRPAGALRGDGDVLGSDRSTRRHSSVDPAGD